MIPDPLERMVPIPVRITADGVESLYGGALPKLKEGAVGTLYIPAFAFGNQEQLQAYVRELTVPLLPKGTRLLAAVPGASQGAAGLYQLPPGESLLPSLQHAFVAFQLAEPLELTLRGSKRAVLRPCRCVIPALASEQPASVNEAYSIISRAFEDKRRSHTGNVFQKVYWLREDGKGGGRWQPLDWLRRPKEAAIEERVRGASRRGG